MTRKRYRYGAKSNSRIAKICRNTIFRMSEAKYKMFNTTRYLRYYLSTRCSILQDVQYYQVQDVQYYKMFNTTRYLRCYLLQPHGHGHTVTINLFKCPKNKRPRGLPLDIRLSRLHFQPHGHGHTVTVNLFKCSKNKRPRGLPLDIWLSRLHFQPHGHGHTVTVNVFKCSKNKR